MHKKVLLTYMYFSLSLSLFGYEAMVKEIEGDRENVEDNGYSYCLYFFCHLMKCNMTLTLLCKLIIFCYNLQVATIATIIQLLSLVLLHKYI